ncbi:MAG TPA: two-component regulator propeller domain-containing protein [Blastocatellia bacterium]|nr:two-component regulator propeller domain-containing protein [Blastocatellia bacterium]
MSAAFLLRVEFGGLRSPTALQPSRLLGSRMANGAFPPARVYSILCAPATSPLIKIVRRIFSPVKHLPRVVAICVFLSCIASSRAVAQYRFDVLNTSNGLPQNTVRGILQTRDGMLWFATLDGLVRYNGARFEVFDKGNSKGINTNRFQSLYEDVDGALWISTADGGLTHYANGRFRTYTIDDGLPANIVYAVRRALDGELLVATTGGLARLQGERFESMSANDSGIAAHLAIQGPSGDAWYCTGETLQRIRGGRITSYTIPSGNSTFFPLYEDRQGRVWLRNLGIHGQLWMLKDEVMTQFSTRDGLPDVNLRPICEDREGTMWFSSTGGLTRLKDGRFTTYTTKDGLSSNWIVSVMEDREGTLWIGTEDRGVMRMTRKVITTISEKDGLRGKIVYPIIEDRSGSIWVGSLGVNRIKDGKLSYYPLNFATISSLHEDREGRLWIGHVGGLFRFQDEEFTADKQMKRGEPLAIFQDSKGAFWFGFSGGLSRYHNGEVKNFSEKDGLQGLVQPIYEDRQGRIWIGGYGGLAQYVDDGATARLVFLTEKDGLSSNRVRAIYEDTDGVLWVGTYDGGLNRYKDGRFTSYTTKEGMFSNGVFAILEDRRANFWMSSNQGIHRVSKQQLNDFADGKIKKISSVSYGLADGMLNTECNGGRQPSAIKTRDGRLWFPTFDGVAVVDPEVMPFNVQPPPVVIETILLDREEVDVGSPVEIRPGQDNLEIRYAGLSFIKPEHMQFKYRLEGLDDDWIDAGNRRVAYFTHLPAGGFVFRVIAANADGVWNQAGAAIDITVIPPFWRRTWFLALVVLLAAAVIAFVFRARIRKLKQAHAVQEAFSRQLIASQESERKRIAAELHDGLGQDLLVIKNWAHLAKRFLEPGSRAGEPLGEIESAVSSSIAEVREIAYNLRPYHLDEIGLTEAIQSMIERVAGSSSVQFQANLDSIDGLLPSEHEMSLYRVIQECINNVVKHSHATIANISIHRNTHELVVRIEDNGKGFDVEQASHNKEHGFGLMGISERVRLLGGSDSIQSVPGIGTTVTITLQVPEKGNGHE